MWYLPVGRKGIKIPLNISNLSVCLLTCSEVPRPLTSTCGSSQIFELQWEKRLCRDHLASEETREGIQMYQTCTCGKGYIHSIQLNIISLLGWSTRLVGLLTSETPTSRRSGILGVRKSVTHATCTDRAVGTQFAFRSVQVTWRFYRIGLAWKQYAIKPVFSVVYFKYNFCIIKFQIQYCCSVNFRKIPNSALVRTLSTSLPIIQRWITFFLIDFKL